jgi:hypothetical protein
MTDIKEKKVLTVWNDEFGVFATFDRRFWNYSLQELYNYEKFDTFIGS